jgi:hypothetical protein
MDSPEDVPVPFDAQTVGDSLKLGERTRWVDGSTKSLRFGDTEKLAPESQTMG